MAILRPESCFYVAELSAQGWVFSEGLSLLWRVGSSLKDQVFFEESGFLWRVNTLLTAVVVISTGLVLLWKVGSSLKGWIFSEVSMRYSLPLFHNCSTTSMSLNGGFGGKENIYFHNLSRICLFLPWNLPKTRELNFSTNESTARRWCGLSWTSG